MTSTPAPRTSSPPSPVAAGLAIRTRGLVHIYRAEGHDVAALSGVDLEVGVGEVVGLLGPSGSGKSTLLSLLGGLFKPSAGKIFLGTDELSAVTPAELDRLRAREVSLMMQGAARNLIPYLTPAENVDFAQQAALRAGKSLPRPAEVLEAVGVADQADLTLTRLTPGDLQLVAVAVALATRPSLLLADEPTSQLDHVARDVVIDAIVSGSRAYGTTVLLVTHDPDVARRLPRTVTIRDGRIGGEGRLGEEYAVVTADGFLPLPDHSRADLPPGTLVLLHRVPEGYLLTFSDGTSDPAPLPSTGQAST